MDRSVEETVTGISYATWQDRQLALILARTGELLRELGEAKTAGVGYNQELLRELGRASALLETREAELRKIHGDLEFWQSKAATLEQQKTDQHASVRRLQDVEADLRARHQRLQEVEADLRAQQQRLQAEVARLSAIESNYAAETRTLNARANAGALEAANLRRLNTELQSSLSWKITAPLRFLTGPLFRALAPKPVPQASQQIPPGGLPAGPDKPEGLSHTATAVADAPVPQPPSEPVDLLARLVESILPELRRASSIAIIPCAIPFSSTLNQRPISCARYLADQGTTVLYVAWQWNPGEAVPQAGEEVYPRVFHLPLYAFLNHVDSIASASYGKGTYFCTLPSPSLVDVVRPLRAAGYHIHYDIMDDWEGFHTGGEAPWFSAPVEREIVVLADTVTAVSGKLVEKFDHLRSDIALVRNGYQPAALGCEQFIAARTPLEGPKVVGYFGHFSDAWFDWDTVIYAAGQLPDVEFELIGWAVSEPTRQRLNGVPNIRLVGIVPQKELHRYARKWWVGIIPFQATQVSAAVDPLKIYEYLHLGLNAVVTGIPGIAGFPLVQFVRDRESFVAALQQIAERPSEQLLSEVAEFLKDCVWEERFAKLNAMIGEPAGLASLYAR